MHPQPTSLLHEGVHILLKCLRGIKVNHATVCAEEPLFLDLVGLSLPTAVSEGTRQAGRGCDLSHWPAD